MFATASDEATVSPMLRSVDELKGSWDERWPVVSWHLRSYWSHRHHLVWAYRRGCLDDAQAILHDLRQWWGPVENRVVTLAAIAVAALLGALISLL
jgi:hypothetical protein